MSTKYLFISLFIFVLTSCSEKNETHLILVKNTIPLERTFETIELSKDFLKVETLTNIQLIDSETGTVQITQLVDNDGDGVMDQLLFQPQVAPTSEQKYEVVINLEHKQQEVTEYCYSRFVPERTDDYTWENDKVAFRVYGPTAQKMIEDSIPGGTLSSGVDAWLKRVDYPVINKWYEETTNKTGSYHEDTGEGLDNFHVGVSRGVGGIAVEKDSVYYFSKNYTAWRTITTGPIRTSFYLNYENWDANGTLIKESKVISLDYGNNFSKFETSIEGTNIISAGLTLHEKDGNVSGNVKNSWVSYWQPHDDSELGTAIVASKKYFDRFSKYETEQKDLSNAYASLNVINNKVVYYAGFGWKKSNQFENQQEWENYLDLFSNKINNPLIVEFIE